jgi:predicted HicB family RNase H-like nuclease
MRVLQVKVPTEIHQAIRVAAATNDCSMAAWVVRAVNAQLEKESRKEGAA